MSHGVCFNTLSRVQVFGVGTQRLDFPLQGVEVLDHCGAVSEHISIYLLLFMFKVRASAVDKNFSCVEIYHMF